MIAVVAWLPAESSVPAMPVIRPNERSANQYPVAGGLNCAIGWHLRSERRGAPVFVVMSRPTVGFQKVIARFPLTEAGWADARQALVRPTPCSLFSSEAGTFARWLSRAYPAAVSARVAGAPMLAGRPASDDAMGRRVVDASAAGCFCRRP